MNKLRSLFLCLLCIGLAAPAADLTTSANVDTLMQAANFAAFRASLGLDTGNSPTFVGLTLGVNTTTLGTVKLFGSTSGDATVQPAAVAGTATVVTLPNASSTLPIFGQQITFSGPTAARTITIRDATDTILELGGSYTPTGTWTSITLVTPILGTPQSGTLTACSGYLLANLTGAGTGVLTALATNNNAAGGYSPIDGTATLTNKRITSRVATLTDAATVTPATDSFDGGILTTLGQATQFINPTGTPTNGQRYWIRVKSTTTRALTYDTQYRGSVDLPLLAATTGSSKTDYLIFQWNSADSTWDFLSKNAGF